MLNKTGQAFLLFLFYPLSSFIPIIIMQVSTIIDKADNIKDQILEYISKKSNLQQVVKITSVSVATYYVIHVRKSS
jgi:predicted PurR-regulated permease PerM